LLWYKKKLRQLILSILARSNPAALLRKGEKRSLRAFKRAAVSVSAYRQILHEHDVNHQDVHSIADFYQRCPILSKANTFSRFSLEELCVPATLNQLSGVLTSSGHGGARFAYGLSTRKQVKRAADDIDLGLEYAFQIDEKKTLLINCLPMGVRFSSNTVTVAETSVREDMAVALATEIGRFYEQIIFVGDPLFFKLLTDYARAQEVDWQSHRIHLIVGEETFGENYRNYLAEHFNLNVDDPFSGLIGSSMGVGELGLNLFYETPQTIRLRRLAHTRPDFFEALFGLTPKAAPLPVIFVYNPLRSHVEILDANEDGYGQLTITMTDSQAPLPLIRYQTGDCARLLSQAHIDNACRQTGIEFKERLNLPVIALKGRNKDELPDGTHIGQYKDALYAHHDIAIKLTGAFRVEYENNSPLVHIQLRRGYDIGNGEIQQRLAAAFPGSISPEKLTFWIYEQFPYGMTIDYERKFTYDSQ